MSACALTGHRMLPDVYDVNRIYDKLEELILGGVDEFYCGMAYGFDLLALSCLVDLRRKHPIRLVACIPYVGQEEHFSGNDRLRYRNLLALCDEKNVLYDHFVSGCFLARDRYMVDRSDVVLAYCVKETGGTAYTVKYAESKNLPVVRIRL